jgi:hypothetical protein
MEHWLRRLAISAVCANVFLMALFKLGDYDVWYHLAVGRRILGTGSVVQPDPFAYTAAGATWSLQSWLAGVVYYLVHTAGGVDGLIVFNAAVLAFAFALVYRTMRLEAEADGAGGFALAASLVLVAAFTARFRFMVRPQGFEFLFLAAVLHLLSLHRARGSVRPLFLLPVIQVLWVNVHGSHILGVLVPLVFLAGAAAQRLIPGAGGPPAGRGRERALLAVVVANLLATLVNPAGAQAFTLPFLITGQKLYMQNIGEWQPMRWAYFTGYGIRYVWGFAVLSLLAVVGLLRRRGRVDPADLALTVLFFVAAVRGIRLSAEFAIVVAPIVFRNLAGAAPLRHPRARKALAALAAAALVLVVPPLVVLGPTYTFGVGVKERVFPERAFAFVEENDLRGPMFNSFPFGDYLCWRAAPERKVFIHGRNDVFPEAFFEEYLSAHRSAEEWTAVTEKYGITYAILQYAVSETRGGRKMTHLLERRDWVPVYWDRVAVVYVKDVPKNAAIVARWGYRHVRPAYFSFGYLIGEMRRNGYESILAEIERLRRQSPDNDEVLLARAFLLYARGPQYTERAIEDVREAITLNPGRAMSRSALGTLYAGAGRRREAEEEFRAALRLDPHDATALAGIKH